MSKEDDRREADALELVLGAASFCLDARTLEEWEGWMVEHEAPFAGLEAKDEHKLEHTEIHAEFVELVEGRLRSWLGARCVRRRKRRRRV